MQDVADRRNSQRFSLRLAVRCRQIKPPVTLGRPVICESVNISSKGLLFTATEAFQQGQVIEASIDWPTRLDDGVRLRLVVEGVVVWRGGDHTAMRIERYQFKTRSAAEWRSGQADRRYAAPWGESDRAEEEASLLKTTLRF